MPSHSEQAAVRTARKKTSGKRPSKSSDETKKKKEPSRASIRHPESEFIIANGRFNRYLTNFIEKEYPKLFPDAKDTRLKISKKARLYIQHVIESDIFKVMAIAKILADVKGQVTITEATYRQALMNFSN